MLNQFVNPDSRYRALGHALMVAGVAVAVVGCGEKEVASSAVDTVKPTVLSPLLGRNVSVKGIIGTRREEKGDYRFQADDGSSIWVYGKYPAQGRVYYRLVAKVADEDGTLYLEEIKKDRLLEEDPRKVIWLFIGGFLVIAGIVGWRIATGPSRPAAPAPSPPLDPPPVEPAAFVPPVFAPPVFVPQAAPPRPHEEFLNPSPTPRESTIVPGMRPPTLVPGALLRAVEGPHKGETFRLHLGENTLGRDLQNVIKLTKDMEVSSSHAVIDLHAGGSNYRDQSRNGSTVDGLKVHHEGVMLSPQSKIVVGQTTLEFERELEVVTLNEAERRAPTLVGAASPSGFTPVLKIIKGPDAGREFPMTGEQLTIGREAGDVVLNDPTISRNHAVIVRSSEIFLIKDASSTYGTLADSLAVMSEGVEIAHNSLITFGRGETVAVFKTLPPGTTNPGLYSGGTPW